MSNIMYTVDGRKVAVIGKLNNQETIVQEIFVTNDGSEIPAGENFVVRSLVSQPVKSWKEKDIADWDARHKRERAKLEEDVKKLERARVELRLKLADVIASLKTDQTAALQHFADVVSGQFQWVVEDSYGAPRIYSVEKFDTTYYDHWAYELKALTVWGKTNGDWLFHLNRYSDGSGDSRAVYLFKTEAEALAKAKALILERKRLDAESLALATKHGWELPAAMVSEFYLQHHAAASTKWNKAIEDSARYASSISELESKMTDLGIEIPVKRNESEPAIKK
jgi:hypothetical protein